MGISDHHAWVEPFSRHPEQFDTPSHLLINDVCINQMFLHIYVYIHVLAIAFSLYLKTEGITGNIQMMKVKTEQEHSKTHKSEDTDQLANLHSLIRSVCESAESNQSLCCSHEDLKLRVLGYS